MIIFYFCFNRKLWLFWLWLHDYCCHSCTPPYSSWAPESLFLYPLLMGGPACIWATNLLWYRNHIVNNFFFFSSRISRTPLLFPVFPVNRGFRKGGWQQSTVDAYQDGLQILPPDAPDIEDNGYSCIVGAFFKASLKLTSVLSFMRSGYPAGCISSLNTGNTDIIDLCRVTCTSLPYLFPKQTCRICCARLCQSFNHWARDQKISLLNFTEAI